MATPKKISLGEWSGTLLTLLAFTGGAVATGARDFFMAGKTIATVPYVDQKHEEALKFAAQIGKDSSEKAFEHSDENKLKVEGEVKDLKIEMASLEGKQNAMADSIKDIKDMVQKLLERRR